MLSHCNPAKTFYQQIQVVFVKVDHLNPAKTLFMYQHIVMTSLFAVDRFCGFFISVFTSF